MHPMTGEILIETMYCTNIDFDIVLQLCVMLTSGDEGKDVYFLAPSCESTVTAKLKVKNTYRTE